MFNLLYGNSPTTKDLVVIHLAAVLAASLLALIYVQAFLPLSFWALVVLVVLALDEVGGIVANATRSTSNWYRHQPALLSYVFHIVHAAQPLLMVLAMGLTWTMFWFLYLYQLIAGVILVRLRGHSVQKPLAASLLSIGIVVYAGFSTVQPVLLILGLMYLIKLVYMFPVNHYASERT